MDITFIPADASLAEVFNEYRQDPVTRQYNPLQPATSESLRERLSKASSDWSQFGRADFFCWFAKSGSVVVGQFNIQNINRMMLTAEIGYGVFANARGRGIATQIVEAMTKEAFTHTPLRKLIAFVHEQNLASRKVLEKVGYRHEGLLREHYLINGNAVNEAVYGILRREVT
jgi:ribosomal-protein-alanine N-acetyltransferase